MIENVDREYFPSLKRPVGCEEFIDEYKTFIHQYKGFRMRDADLTPIKGTRPQDLEVFLNDNQYALNIYKVLAIICGGICFKEKMKNGICRPKLFAISC